jgi:hypothetical protein
LQLSALHKQPITTVSSGILANRVPTLLDCTVDFRNSDIMKFPQELTINRNSRLHIRKVIIVEQSERELD